MIKRILGASSLCISTIGIYKYNTDSDVKRAITLYKELGPVISHYRYVEFKQKYFPPSSAEEGELEFSLLHDKYSTPVLETLRDLRGFYIKVGQIMANRSDVLPEIYIEKLRTLEDQVPHLLNGDQAKALIQESLQIEDFDSIFKNFSEIPIGSASIGQVHKAVLVKNNKPVAIKIQSPGAEALFRGDLKVAKSFCQIFVPEQVILFEEIEKQFMTEFDYRYEADNLKTVGENMKHFRNVVVPKPYFEYCSKSVLTMEFLKGPKLVDGIRKQGEIYAKSLNKTLKELESDMRKDFDEHGLPSLYKGPSAFQMEVYRKLLKTKDGIINLPIWLINIVLGTVGIRKINYYESFIPLNSAYIMDTLLKVHGHQLLVNGVFNADTHPGNFLLMDNGCIGMIDYGQVKRLTDQERILMCRMVHALATEDRDGLRSLNEEVGYKSKYMNKDVIYKMCQIAFDRDGRDVTEGLNLQQFIDKMYNLDPWEETPSFSIMPSRLSLLLRGVGLMLNHPVSICRAWDHIAVAELNVKQ